MMGSLSSKMIGLTSSILLTDEGGKLTFVCQIGLHREGRRWLVVGRYLDVSNRICAAAE
jgi:hypothetical protein